MIQKLLSRSYLRLLLVFLLFFSLFAAVYFSVGALSSNDDHFFHIKLAQIMSDKGIIATLRDFKGIYWSRMAQGGDYLVYYNFLFYLVLIPFTYAEPLFFGIKLYSVVMAALSFTIFYWVLGRFSVRWPFLATLALFALTNNVALWRFFLARPYAFAPTLLILLLLALQRRRYGFAALLSGAYVFWHCATFFFPFSVAVVYYIFEKFCREKGNYRNLLAVAGGTVGAIGLCYLLVPGFFQYSWDIIFGVYYETIVGKKVILPEGGELYSSDFFNYLNLNGKVLSLAVAAGAVEIYHYWAWRWRRLPEEAINLLAPLRSLRLTLFFLTAGFFLATTLISARFGDYFVFFVGLYLVLMANALLPDLRFSSPFVGRGLKIGGAIMLLYFMVMNSIFLQQMLGAGPSPEEFKGVGTWLKENTKAGELVFEANWSWFPGLFYYSPDNYYLTGLEPRFFYTYSPHLYWLWSNLAGHGFVCDQEKCLAEQAAQRFALKNPDRAKIWYKEEGQKAARVLRSELRSPYVVTSRSYGYLNALLAQSDQFKQVYGGATTTYFIFQVK